MGLLALLMVALVPVIEVLIVTGVGCLLAFDRINILGPTGRHHLNNLVFFVFSPALIVSQLGETITFQSLESLWFMPVNILLTFIIGSALAWVLIKVTRTPPEQQGLVIGCCSAGNLGNLLLIMVPAVCEQSDSPFGDTSTCSAYGTAYASLSMAVGAVYIWTYVYVIMRIYARTVSENGNQNEWDTLPDQSEQGLLNSPTSGPPEKETVIRKALSCISKCGGQIDLKMVFAPSTIAAIIGFFIGAVSPVRELLIGDSAPLHVLDTSASLIGGATVPSMTLVVGANLVQGLRRSQVSASVVVGIIVVRYLLLPLLGVGVVKAAYYFGMVGSDSLYQFVLLLQYALPPAMTVGIIAQLFEAGESECSVIMLWTYLVASFSLTLWSTFYMWLLE